ncbi:MAG TPA: hypothetical protein VJB11_00445 [archaeon]|nr:hypothetical protein [archaeon]
MATELLTILETLGDQAVGFIPGLVGAAILLIIGLIVGKIVGRVVKEVLLRVNLDYYVTENKKPVISLADMFTVITRWWIYLAFVAAAVSVLSISELTLWVRQILNFIPNIVGAALIIAAGYVIAEYIKTHIKKTGTLHGALVAKILTFFILYVAIALALPVLGIPSTLVGNILLVIIGSLGVGIAIALGLGLKDAVADVSKRYVRKLKV